jgi:hypothetical protein
MLQLRDVLYPNISSVNIKGTEIPVHAYYRHTGFQEVEDPIFLDDRYMKVVRLLALRTGRLYLLPPPRKSSWYSFLLQAESTPRP